RSQVVQRRIVLDRAEVGPQHAAELLGLGPLAAGAAVRARDLRKTAFRRPALAGLELLLELVGPIPAVAVRALRERIGERRDVARRLPHLRREDDRGVDAEDVVATGDHRLPPLAADVLLELHAERTVVPRRAGAAVDLARRVDEAAALAQIDDGVVTGGGGVGGHGVSNVDSGGDSRISGGRRLARHRSTRLPVQWTNQAA